MDKEEYKLPILDTLHKAIVTIADNSSVLFRALLFPSIIMILVSIGQKLMYKYSMSLRNDGEDYRTVANYIIISNFSTSIVLGILAALFAVICHRIVLLGKDSLPNSFGLYFSKRELKYFGWVFLFGLPMGIGFLILTWMLTLFGTFDHYPNVFLLFSRIWGIAGLVIVTFITAPFILVLPATAVGEKRVFKMARATVRGNIIRLAVVLLLPALITLLIRWALRHFGPETSNIPYDVITGLIYLVFLVFQTVALSVSYKSLASDHLEETY